MKRIIFILLLSLWVPALRGQDSLNFPLDKGSWIENQINGLKVRIVSNGTDEWDEDENSRPGSRRSASFMASDPPDTTGRKIIRDTLVLKRILNGNTKLESVYLPDYDLEMFTSFTARNGMKVSWHNDYYVRPEYFPDDGLLVLVNRSNGSLSLMLDVDTGEDAFFPSDITTSPDGNLRIVRKYYPWENLGHVVQRFDPRIKDYRDIAPLEEFTSFGENEWLGPWSEYHWIENVLYATDGYRHYRLTFETVNNIGPDVKTRKSGAPPRPIPIEMQVRDPLEIDYGMTDHTFSVHGHKLRFRRIPRVDFHYLREYYGPRQVRPEAGIEGIGAIREELPGYSIVYYRRYGSIFEVRKEGSIRMMLSPEKEGGQYYYHDEGILMYAVGHGADAALNVRTGEKEDYNPAVTVYSPDRRFRITGLHDGQDSYNYRLDKRSDLTGKYTIIAYLYEINRALPQDYRFFEYWADDFFWIGDTCYFRCGEECCSLTMPGE